MFPKKGQVWTNRERGRSLGLGYGIAAVACLAFGLYLGVAQANWLAFIIAVVTAAAAGLYVYVNERDHRGEP
jgi:formate hydrogenlyase subunit 3/multisubunit Na+/H+ antiporter MnhD subunit